MLRSVLVASSLLAAAVCAGPASAASFLAKSFSLTGPNYSGDLPACDDPGVTGQVVSQFAHKESHYWASPLTIGAWDRFAELAYRPWGSDYIPRRFCQARVVTSDGIRRIVSYSVGEDLGLAGFGYGVQWCVSGTDRNLAYAPDCRQARP